MRDDELEDIFAESDNEEIEELFAEEDDSSKKSSPQVPNNFNNNPILQEKFNNLRKNKLPDPNLENITNNLNTNINKMQNNIASMEQQEINSAKEEQGGILGSSNNLLKAKTVASQTADDTLKKELSHIILKKILTKKIILVMGISLLAVLLIIVFVLIASTLKDDESEINTRREIIDVVKGDMTYEEITDYLVYMGICREIVDEKEEEKACMESGFGQFILEFKKVYENYQQYLDKNNNPIELDIPLIMETISYNRSDNDLIELLETSSGLDKVKNELYELAQAQVEYIQETGNYYYYGSDGKCYVTKDKKIGNPYYIISDDKYVSYLKYGKVHENYSGSFKLYDAKVHPDSEKKCIPEGKSYAPPNTNRYVGEEIIEDNTNNGNDSNTNINPDISTNIKTQEITIPISGLSKKYKIAWVSDLHLIAEADRKNSTTAQNRYDNDFYTSGTHSDEWLKQIVTFLNNGNFDAVIFGGDMVDQGTAESIKLFKNYYDQINISKKMYVRADHDYLYNLYGTSGNQGSITATSSIYSFSIENVTFIGIDYSNKDLSSDAYSTLKNKIEGSSNVIIATHVPYESKVNNGLKDKSMSIRNRLYYWQSLDSSDSTYYYANNYNANMNNYFNNYIYKNSNVKYVLSGHMHASWNGLISSNGLKEQVFEPAYNGYVGIINLEPK